MNYKLFRYRYIYFVTILYSLFGSGFFGYIVVRRITEVSHIGFGHDDFIYFPLNIISFISFLVSFYLILKLKLFSVTTLNIGITSTIVLTILGLIRSYYSQITFKFLFQIIIFLVVNVILLIIINKFKISEEYKVCSSEIDHIGKPE